MSDYRIVTGRRKKLENRIAELEQRLEIEPNGHDGIYCRDETIRLLNDRIEELNAENTFHGSAAAERKRHIAKLETENQRLKDALQAIRELPEKWRNERGSGPTSDPMKAGMDIGIVACADELEAQMQFDEDCIKKHAKDFRQLQAKLDVMAEQYVNAVAKLDAVNKLPEKWRKYTFDNPEATSYIDSADCADELEEALGEVK